METRLILKVLHLILHHRAIKIILLLICVSCATQQAQIDEEKSLLYLELIHYKKDVPNLEYTKSVVGDSILLNKQILKFSKTIDEVKNISLQEKIFTIEEADEVFSTEYNLQHDSEEWAYELLPKINVVLYDNKKYTSAATLKKSDKIGVGTFTILSMSKPIFRKDHKYALILISSEHHGGILHIYKKTNIGWTLYKNVQLYLI